MLNSIKSGLKAVALASVIAGTSQALSIPFLSTTADTCTTSLSDSCSLVEITAHNRWQDAYGGAQWVSPVNSGVGGGTVSVPNNTTTPYLTITETFTLAGDGNLTFDIWADDTARVSLDGNIMFDENLSQNICADGTIGCEPDENETFNWDLLAGTHTVTFDIFQVGGGPAGVLYVGELTGGIITTNTPVPEPRSLALLGLGLIGLGFARRKAAA